MPRTHPDGHRRARVSEVAYHTRDDVLASIDRGVSGCECQCAISPIDGHVHREFLPAHLVTARELKDEGGWGLRYGLVVTQGAEQHAGHRHRRGIATDQCLFRGAD